MRSWIRPAAAGVIAALGAVSVTWSVGAAGGSGGDDSRRPRLVLLHPEVLHQTREAVRNGDERFRDPVRRLLRDADKAMTAGPFSVTEKSELPPGGDRHEYLSLSRYWWPDPDAQDGLPYIRRDGEVNPEALAIPDHEELTRMGRTVHGLALAYYFSGREQYGERAVLLLRAWFLDSATCMRPNLRYSQMIRGRDEPRGWGVLDGRAFLLVADAVGLLELSPSWPGELRPALVRWFRDYLRWLLDSPHGRLEAAATNNHGVWYDAQVAGIALFVGDDSTARRVAREARTKRIGAQIEPDGTMPRELARTLSEHYTHFNLEAFMTLAQIARHAGVDLWHTSSNDGRGIRRILDHVVPVLRNERSWEWPQIRPFDRAVYYPELLQAAREYADLSLLQLADSLGGEKARSHRANLLYGYGR